MDPDPVPPLPIHSAEADRLGTRGGDGTAASAAPGDASPRSHRRARTRRLRRRAAPLGLFAAGVLAAGIAVALYGALVPAPPPLTQRDVSDSIAKALASQTPGPPLSEAAYAAIQPSVVLVEAVQGSGGASPTSGPSRSAGPGGETLGSAELGSGVVIDDAGDVMTALHVVANADAVSITFADGTRSPAEVLTREPANDIAVLRTAGPPAGVTPAVLGDPRSLRIGSEAFVVGNPFGLDGSMSSGVVSGLGRTFRQPNGGPELKGLIQVDAAVNPGNSGGPLVDRNGRVLGIVTGLINPTKEGVFIGIGLAVPIDEAGSAAGLPQY